MTLLRASLICLVGMYACAAFAAEYAEWGGTYSNWPTTWIPLPGLNDPVDFKDSKYKHLDFVGNATYPGAYYQWDSSYFYFRMRMNVGTISHSNPRTYGDTLFILIDLPGVGTTGQPDYAFAWDSKEIATDHGVELLVPGDIQATWSQTTMNDIDGNVGQKLTPPDFGADGDAYLRTIDGNSTTDFGDTSYVDWAISFAHLQAYTQLRLGQTWYIQLGSIANANDHNKIDGDIAGGYNKDSNVVGSINTPVTTPEPASMALTLLALGIAGGAVRRRRSKDASDTQA